MRKSLFVCLLLFAVSFFILSSCAKYEEGPKYTILTKKARITNTWILRSISFNGSGDPLTGSSIWLLDKDMYAEQAIYENNTTTIHKGNWDFNGPKTKLIITQDDAHFEEYTIVRLKNKELKLSQNAGDDVIVWTFEAE